MFLKEMWISKYEKQAKNIKKLFLLLAAYLVPSTASEV
jgi:hypothetical protein